MNAAAWRSRYNQLSGGSDRDNWTRRLAAAVVMAIPTDVRVRFVGPADTSSTGYRVELEVAGYQATGGGHDWSSAIGAALAELERIAGGAE